MPAPTVTKPPIPRWRAFDRRGEAHAFLTRQSPRSACGTVKRPPDERHDWPRKSRCTRCQQALAGTD